MDRRWLAWPCLILLCGGELLFGQPSTAEPVAQLRRTLMTRFASLTERDSAISARMQALQEISELFEALRLKEWRFDDPDRNVADVDQASWQALACRFTEAARAILRDSSSERKLAAIEMIRTLGDKLSGPGEGGGPRSLAPDLIQIVLQSKGQLGEEAARALGASATDSQESVAALQTVLASQYPSARLAAADALAHMMARLHYRAVQARTQNEKHDLRGDLSRSAATVIPLALKSCQDPDPRVRGYAVQTISECLQALQPLSLDTDARAAVEPAHLKDLLDSLKNSKAALMKTLNDIDPAVRIQTRLALEDLAVIQKPYAGVEAGARDAEIEPVAYAVAEQKHVEEWCSALPGVMAGVSDPDVRARLHAIDILETLGPIAEPAAPVLVNALRDHNRFVRWAAARALGKIGPVQAETTVPALERLLADSELDVRLAGARSLAAFGAKAEPAMAGLVRALDEKNTEQRLAVLQVLDVVGAPGQAAIPNLCACLADPDARVRRKAAMVLGKLGPLAHAATDILRQSLRDDDGNVRQAAGKALLLITRTEP